MKKLDEDTVVGVWFIIIIGIIFIGLLITKPGTFVFVLIPVFLIAIPYAFTWAWNKWIAKDE